MRSIGTFDVTQGAFPVPCGGREATATLVLKNLSGYELGIRAGGISDIIGAHTYERIDVGSLVSWDGNLQVTPDPLASNFSQAPSQVLVVTAYAPGEPVSGYYPISIDRLSNVGNQLTVTSTTGLKNDNNGPGTQVIETTPSDQGSSAFNLNNDGSGLWQVLSAGVQRVVAQVFRGNNTSGKATIQIGDSGDATITKVYGSLQGGQAATVGAITGTGANSLDGGKITTNGSGTLGVNGLLQFLNTLSSGNEIADFLQGYQLFSDNVGSSLGSPWVAGTTRLWIQAPDMGEVHVGPRSGATILAGMRIRARGVLIDATNSNSEAPGTFEVKGGMNTWLDAGNITTDGTNGTITKLGGQATAGSFGVPVIVAQALRQNVSTVATVTIISYTVPTSGVYRLSGAVMMQDTTARAIAFNYNWTDPDSSVANAQWFFSLNASTIQAMNTTNTWASNIAYALNPAVVTAKAGTTLSASYQHPVGTPNDFVTVLVERLA